MRGTGVLLAVIVAATLGLGCGELLAAAKAPVVATSMTSRPDLAQLQSAAWEWLTATLTSTPFIVGLFVGIFLAEAGRFTLRWLLRLVGIAAHSVSFVVRYRLLAVGLSACIYYVTAYHVMA